MHYPALLILGNLLMVLIAAACGWWLVAPWAVRNAGARFAAPFAGLLALPATTLLIYAGAGIGYRSAAMIALSALLMASILSRPWPTPCWRDGAVIALVVLAATCLVCSNAIMAGEPAILFLRGTDQAGYAQVADWLIRYPVQNAPVADISKPLQSWPANMFASDPRFGSFALLALVTLARGGPALFSYDAAQALLLSAGVLAVTGTFIVNRIFATLLGIVLLTGAWLDLGGSGYLGKLFGYPAALLLGGLLAGADGCPPERRLGYGATVVLFALAAASAYPGHVLALLAGAIGIAGTLAATWHDKAYDWHRRFGLQLTLMSMIAASFASGMVARPLQPGYPKWSGSWGDALAIALGTKSASLQNLMPDSLSRAGGVAGLVAGLVLVILAHRNRNPVAFGLAAASAGLSIALLSLGGTASLPQLVGFAGPALLIAATLLASTTENPARRLLAAGVLAVLAALTAQTSVATFRALWPARDTDIYVLRQAELEGLIARLAGQQVILDVAKPVQWSLSFMLLAGERMTLSYSSASWNALFGYRDWPVPPESAAAGTRIVAATSGVSPSEAVARTRQFMAVPAGLRPPPADQLPEALLREASTGIWEDGWLERHATLALPAGKAAALTLVIAVPGGTGDDNGATTLSISTEAGTPLVMTLATGDNRISFVLPESTDPRHLSLDFSKVRKLAAPDRRESAGRLLELGLAP